MLFENIVLLLLVCFTMNQPHALWKHGTAPAIGFPHYNLICSVTVVWTNAFATVILGSGELVRRKPQAVRLHFAGITTWQSTLAGYCLVLSG
jgi:hypothetical protein